MWTLPRKVVLGRRKTMMTFSAVLVTLCLASTVHGNQLGPVKSNPNAQQRPQAARRPVLQQNVAPDPLDSHLDRMFANFDEKNGKDDSLWDRLKRNFVEEDKTNQVSEPTGEEEDGGEVDRSARVKRGIHITPGPQKVGKIANLIFDAALVAGQAAVRVFDKEYSIRRVIRKAEITLDMGIEQGPGLMGRLDRALASTSQISTFGRRLDDLMAMLRPLNALLPRVNRFLDVAEQIDFLRFTARADSFLIRLNRLPFEKMVDSLFHSVVELTDVAGIARQFQRQLPQLILLMQQQQQRPGGTTTVRPAEPVGTQVVVDGGVNETTTLPPQLVNIDPRLLARFEPRVIQNLNPAVFPLLTPERLMRVNATYLNLLEPHVLANVRPDIITELEPEMLNQVSPEILNALPGDIIRDISAEMVRGFDPELLRDVDPELIKGLDSETIRALLFSQGQMAQMNRRDFTVIMSHMTPQMMKAFKAFRGRNRAAGPDLASTF